MAEARRSETARGKFHWGELDWYQTPGLGFDQCWVAGGGAYLLLRQGKTVALVGCTGLDLTSPDNLGMLRTRLELEGS